MVIKNEIWQSTTYKTHTETFAYLMMKHIWIERIAKLKSHTIYRKSLKKKQLKDIPSLALNTIKTSKFREFMSPAIIKRQKNA